MTWSAPIEATISTFGVLHTPVTSAPNALALVLEPDDCGSEQSLLCSLSQPSGSGQDFRT
jgi:hypothetical protein